MTERLARETSLKSVVTPPPTPIGPIQLKREQAPTSGPVTFRGEPGETAPPIGYDPKIITGEFKVKTKQDADRYVTHVKNYNLHLSNLQNHADKQIAGLEQNLLSAQKNLVAVLRTPDKYTQESLNAYQKSVDKYSTDVKANITSLNTYKDNLGQDITTNKDKISKVKDWASSIIKPQPAKTTTTTRKGWKVTITDPNTGKKTVQTFWSREEMDKYLERATRGKPTKTTGKGKVQLDRPTDSGIIWDPGYGPTGIEALGPVSEQDKNWFNNFFDSIKNNPIVTSITQSRDGATKAAQGIKNISNNLKESGGFPTTSEKVEIKNQIQANPWLAYDTKIWDDPPKDATELVTRIAYMGVEGSLGVLDELTFPFGRLTRPEDELDVGIRIAASLVTPTHWDWIIGKVIHKLGDVGSNIINKLRRGVKLTPQEIKVVNGVWGQYTDDVVRYTNQRSFKEFNPIDIMSESMDDLFGTTTNADEISAIADDLASNRLSDISKNWDEITPSAYNQQKTVKAMQREIRSMRDFVHGLDPIGVGQDTIRHWDIMTTNQKKKFLEDVATYIDDFYKDPTKLGGAGAGIMAPESILKFETVMTEAGFTPQDAITAIMRGDPSTFISPDLLTAALLYLQSPLTQNEIQSLGISDVRKFREDLETELKKKIDINPITDILVVPGLVTEFDEDIDILPVMDLDVDIIPIVEPIELPDLDILPVDVTIGELDDITKIDPVLKPPALITDVSLDIDAVTDVALDIDTVLSTDPIERQVQILRSRLRLERRESQIPKLTKALRVKLLKQQRKDREKRRIPPSKKSEPYRVVFQYTTGASETEWVDAKNFHHAYNVAERLRKIKLVPLDVLVEHRPGAHKGM